MLNYINYIIIAILSILCFVQLILLISIFRKVRSASNDKINLIEFPLETNNKINSFINEVRIYLNQLGKLVSVEQKNAVKEINERLKIFEKFAGEKNDELKKFKEGYDFSKQKNIITGVLDCIDLIEKAKEIISNVESKNYLEALHEKLEIILSNNGIEKFTPSIDKKFFEIEGCEPSNIIEQTNDENKKNYIHSVLKPGYKIILKDNINKVIKKSVVKIYG